jgi:di/tricarboxylate transporter
MSTQYADEQTTRGYPGQHQHRGSDGWNDSRRRRPKPFFLTSEFLTLVAAVAAVAIAAAVADNLEAPRAWTLIAILCGSYIVSRGLSKIGRGDGVVERD